MQKNKTGTDLFRENFSMEMHGIYTFFRRIKHGIKAGAYRDEELVMVEVTKINGVKVLINPDLLELVEETPDTVLTFTTGRKIIVKESRQEVKNLVKSYKKDIFAN